MTPLNSRLRALFAPALAVLLLAACNGSDNAYTAIPAATVQIIHASPEAPAVDASLNGAASITNLDYGQASVPVTVKAGTLNVAILGRLPGTSRPAVIGPADILSITRNFLINFSSLQILLASDSRR